MIIVKILNFMLRIFVIWPVVFLLLCVSLPLRHHYTKKGREAFILDQELKIIFSDPAFKNLIKRLDIHICKIVSTNPQTGGLVMSYYFSDHGLVNFNTAVVYGHSPKNVKRILSNFVNISNPTRDDLTKYFVQEDLVRTVLPNEHLWRLEYV